jgi:AcrR family transcriptional regulator
MLYDCFFTSAPQLKRDPLGGCDNSAARIPSMPTRAAKKHVDAEIAQALELGLAFRGGPSGFSPVALRAMTTAFAAHFRALMEFFHDMRPGHRNPDTRDWILSEFLPPGARNPFHGSWSLRERRRFDAADKLVGHLSKGRRLRHHATKDWGHSQDRAMLLHKVRHLFKVQPRARTWFPRTFKHLAQY